jgi:hypothetical protein
MKKLRYLLPPVLFSIFPILSLFSYNVESVSFSDFLLSFMIILICGLGIVFLLRALLNDLKLAGILTALLLLFFFSYGHVYNGYLGPAAQSIFRAGGLVGNSLMLFSLWTFLFILAVMIIIRLRAFSDPIASFFTVAGIILIIAPGLRVLSYEMRLNQPLHHEHSQAMFVKDDDLSRPDIYYIILDGYGRADVLREYYEFDNSDFISFLKENGFFVAEQSQSNYLQTALSLSSSLNMDYLNFLSEKYGDSDDRSPAARLVKWNTVLRILKSFGYTIVASSTGYRLTELTEADIYYRPLSLSSSNFQRLIFETSALVLLNDIRRIFDLPLYFPGYRRHRERILRTLEGMGEISKIPGPKFVFTHLIAPHPPFIFDAQGEFIQPDKPFNILDGSAYSGDLEEYTNGYRQQLIFVNSQMKKIIGEVLNNSEEPPVIIIQGDHGPGSRFEWNSPDKDGLTERFGILNAYYLPGINQSKLYEEITPVNSFRLVFNEYFGANYTLLPDISYYSNWERPYDFVEEDEIMISAR